MLDRTTPPPIRQLSEFSITRPDRRTMKNGMPLNIIHAGTEDVVRFDLLIGGGQWNQEQPLQLCSPTGCCVRELEINVFTDCGAIGLLRSLAGVIFFRELWIHNTLLSE